MTIEELLFAGGVLVLIVLSGLVSLLLNRKLSTPKELSRKLGLTQVAPGPGEVFRLHGETAEGWSIELCQSICRRASQEETVTSWTIRSSSLRDLELRLEPRAGAESNDSSLSTGDDGFDRDFRLTGGPAEVVLGAISEGVRLRSRKLLEELRSIEVKDAALVVTAPLLPPAAIIVALFELAREMVTNLGDHRSDGD